MYKIIEYGINGVFDEYEIEASNLKEAYEEAWDNYVSGDNPVDGDDVRFDIFENENLLWSGRRLS